MNPRMMLPLLAALLVLGSYPPVFAQDTEKSCEEWRCEFQSRLETECQCDAQSNHGRYVSCVAHLVNDLVDEGLPTNCKGKLKRCAARSVCGKQDRGFVTCTTTVAGDCDEAAGTCLNDSDVACTVDTDCDETRCHIRRGAENCEGEVNLAPTCCASCAAP